MMTVLSYHNTLSLPTVLPTPESADSTAYGTRMFPLKVEGIFSCVDFGTMENCQSPFKLIQLLFLTICGRGYSGSGAAGFTLSVHGVVMCSPAGFQPGCCANVWEICKK